VVCLAESFIYNDASAALEPEVDRAAAVVSLLLGVEADAAAEVQAEIEGL
jgi:hypothetical protein